MTDQAEHGTRTQSPPSGGGGDEGGGTGGKSGVRLKKLKSSGLATEGEKRADSEAGKQSQRD